MAQTKSEPLQQTTPVMASRGLSELNVSESGTLVVETTASEPAEPQVKRKSAAGKVGLFVLLLLVGGLAWHVATDQLAPSSSTGSVTALTALVAPRVAGQVHEVLVSDNQAVQAGEPLFTLDPAPFELTLRQAQAQLDTVTQTVGASVISLASTEAKVNQAQAALDTTRVTTERTQSLFDRGLTAQSAVDTANAQLATAASNLQAAQAELESAVLRAGGAGTNPQVETASVQLEQAQLNRSFATITAPSDGVVTNLKLAPGQYINAGTPALTFIEDNSKWVVVDMRENQLANIQVGDEANLVFDGVPGRSFDARVRGIALGIDPGRTAANGLPQNQAMTRWFEPARTIPVHLELIDPSQWPTNVRVGSKVSALVFSQGRSNPIAFIANALQTVSSYVSFLY